MTERRKPAAEHRTERRMSVFRSRQPPITALARPGRRQVVSTTGQPLFDLVATGLFDEALYYRLNMTFLKIDSPSPGSGGEGG
jgi:hypothetical protein